jgi:NhaA family Na+:H+ antiporter
MNPFKRFIQSEQAAGVLLLLMTVVSLVLANSPVATDYLAFWHWHLGPLSLELWINDALMAVFFLLIGLELSRELNEGELQSPRQALLPVVAALGGMVVPALCYLSMTEGTPYTRGLGIPMATDIAFALAVIRLTPAPMSLKVFLTALAVADDMGAILMIALFYSQGVVWAWLAGAAGVVMLLVGLNRRGIGHLTPYLLLGAVLWLCLFKSGVHATLAGVILAFTIPFRPVSRKDQSVELTRRLEHHLHWPVAMIILPLFALANTAVPWPTAGWAALLQPEVLGIALGLVVGKPVGIFLFTLLAIRLGAIWPSDLNKAHLLGAGCLGGIGFTMSIFVTLLAFDDHYVVQNAKLGILLSSSLAGALGFGVLRVVRAKASG